MTDQPKRHESGNWELRTTDGRHLVFNGGEPLPGCPDSWNWANQWESKVNEDARGPAKWRWDCGFKLDYDGDIVSISSRFYPPAKYYGPHWDGIVHIFIGDSTDPAHDREFECETLEELREQVEAYCNEIAFKMQKAVLEVLNES